MNIFDPHISGSLSVSGSGVISGDLTVLGTINATISGTTSNALTASEAPRYTLTSSFETFTSSIVSKTGSYATTGSNLFKGTQTHSGSIVPSVDNTYDLGSPDYQWRDVYISSGSLYIDGTKVLSSTAQELTITTDNGQSLKILEGTTDSIVLQVADGDIELKSSADGDILLDPTNGKIMLKGPVEILNGQKIQSSVNGTPVVFANDIVVSGSIELTGTIDGIDLSSLSSSLNTRIGSIESSTTSLNSFTSSASGRLDAIETSTGSLNGFTSSINTTIKNKLNTDGVISGSEQIILSGTTGFSTVSASLSSLSSSISITNFNQDGRLTSIESKTGSFATTGSNNFVGSQTITGSLVITQNLQVLGSSSFLYVTSSQLNVSSSTISVNIFEPAERFGGLKVYDSGSSAATASLLWDSLNNRFVYQNVDGASYNGAVLIGGPRNSGSLGDEPLLTSGKIPKSVGGDHIDNSIMSEVGGNTIAISGGLVITGSILSTVTPLVSGSSQITYGGLTSIPSGIISGSSQVVSLLPSGTVSGSSQVLVGSGVWSGSAQLPSGVVSGSSQISFNSITDKPTLVSGSSQITFSSISNIPGGLVSGSSQIDLTSTTNYSSGIKTRLNAEGVVSGSSQITLSSTTGYVASLPLAGGTLTGDLYIDQSGQQSIVFRTSSAAKWNLANSVASSYFQIFNYTTNATALTIANSSSAATFASSVTATSFSGAGTGLTGTASSLSIGGNAATATSATTATTATKLSGGGSAGDAYIILYDNNSGDLNTYNSPGIYSSEYVGSTNRPGSQNGHWIQISDNGGTDVKSQWYYDSDGANLYTRVMWGNGTWKSWKTMIHSGNIGSQSVSSATTSTNSTNLSGLGIIQSTSTGTSYQYNYQVRENSGGGGNTSETYAPQLAFHWSGVVASSIMMESSGRIAVRNNPGTSYENFIASTIYANSSFQGNLTGNVTGNVTGTANNITAYTINQNLGTSNSPTFSNIYANDWYRNNAVNEGLYNEATNNHWYSENSGRWTAAGTNASYGEISLRYGHQGTYKGSYYWDGSGIGLLNEQGGWSVRCNYGSGYGGTLYGSWTVTGTLTETSSTRYKTNIKTIESGLDKVLQMRGVVYNRKDNGKEEIGVIAEEMNEILPQVIQYNTESEIDSVSYSRIVGVLIEAIKELKQEINDLKNNG
jgi:hypothetical protein